jgi:predicted ATPase/class 3 adenylate cyclase
VTLLFGDIEGSTHLLRSLGDEYAGVLARERRLVREIAGAAHGVEVDAAGDGAFFAFATAADAVSAAASIQRALAGEQWPRGHAPRLRIGIHTGSPEIGEEGYVGIDVHRAARICAAAHGGQVVVSQPTRELVATSAPAGLSFRSLGLHRLKDFPAPTSLYQLVGEGLDDEFAPLRTLGGASLPALHHRLVGRRAEREEIEHLLARDDVRLVTLTGPGGAGKSRLALEVAAARADTQPVWLVGLASISDPALVPAAIARALGVRESAQRSLVEDVATALEGRRALLVLDNLEHLPTAAATLARLLDLSADTTILATSRASLRLSSERVCRVAPLRVDDAATLFTELAEARGIRLPDDSNDVVRAICRRLDGLPLAIELVVARLALLPPAALLRALDSGLTLAAEGPADLPERQRTLRATIDWSYGLLSADQRDLHARLAVFAGGCTIADAEAVCGDGRDLVSDLTELVESSLLRVDTDEADEPRISMLETVREYAVEWLAAADRLDEARARHTEHFLLLARAAEDGLSGPDQAEWLDRLEREHDNLRVALQHALEAGRVDEALRAVAALGRFWRAHGHVGEARAWLRAGLASTAPVSDETRARALWTSARQAMAQGRPDAAVPALDEALALFRSLGERRDAVFAECELSQAHLQLGSLDEAEQAAVAGLAAAREMDDARALSAALNTLAGVAVERSDYPRARSLYEESLALRRLLDDPLLVVNSANNLGLAAFREGDHEAAVAALEECLALARQLGDELHAASALCALGEIALGAGAPDRARSLLLDAISLYVELDDERMLAECVHTLGGVAAASAAWREAALLWGAADAMRGRLGAQLVHEERSVLSQFDSRVRQNLGDREFERAGDEGGRASLDDLLALTGGGSRAAATREMGGESDG